MTQAEKNTAQELLKFIEKSPSCFHAVENIRQELISNGFTELKEQDSWNLSAGGMYFTVRNQSSLIAFILPQLKTKPDSLSFRMTASHSDSPCFKIKENPELTSAGFVKLNAEKYGGMLLNPWFDRPLSLAGRVILRQDRENFTTAFKTVPVNFDRNLLLIPNLAIHMNRDANDGHKIDVQNELMPVISSDPDFKLLPYIAEELKINKDQIEGFDLYLYNRDKGSFWGAGEEFIVSPRLDDLECAWTTMKGFINSKNKKLEDTVKVYCIFDNEETGSQSRQGAASTFLKETLLRINSKLGYNEEQYYQALAKSFMVSADNAHSVHPNYVSSSDPVNRPEVNKGPVIKFNASQKYTSDGVSGAMFKKICRDAGVPFQVFTNNSNSQGGSTLGNISTEQVSVLSVDVGLAQWAMHSPMESAGAEDVDYMIRAVTQLFC